jgi:hypothetical protein
MELLSFAIELGLYNAICRMKYEDEVANFAAPDGWNRDKVEAVLAMLVYRPRTSFLPLGAG